MTGVTESSGWVEVSDKEDEEDEEEVGEEAELEETDLYCGTERMTFLCDWALTVRSRGEPGVIGEVGTVSLLGSELMICFTGLAPFLLLAPVGLLLTGWAWPASIVLLLKYSHSQSCYNVTL